MADEPIYFLSGFDRVSTLPAATEALLSNAPSILQSSKLISNPQYYINSNLPKYFMTDSGGKQIFSITSGKKTRYKGYMNDPEKPAHYRGYFNWTPEHWKKSILKDIPTYAISMDYPIPFNKLIQDHDTIYEKANQINLTWAKDCLRIRKEYFPQTKIFVPFQGYTFQQLDEFVNNIGGNDFTGLCLPMRCYASTERFISFLKQIKKIGIKSLHLLGTSRLDVIAIVNYLCFHDYFKFISYDSCTIGLSARSDKMLLPFDLRPIKIYERAEEIEAIIENDSIDVELITVNEFQELKNMIVKERIQYLTNNNYNSIMTTKRELFSNSKSINSIVKYLSERSIRKDTIQIIQKSLQEFEQN